MDNTISTLLQEGTTFHLSGDLEEAERKYRAVLTIDHDHAVAHNNLGFLLLQRGAYDDSIQEYRRAIASNPDYATAYTNLGQAFLLQRNLGAAETMLGKAIDLGVHDAQTLEALGKCYMLAGKAAAAEPLLRKVYELKPEADILLDLAWSLIHQNKVTEAYSLLDVAQEKYTATARYYSLLGMVQFMSNNFGAAIYNYRQSLGLEPENIETRNSLAACLLKVSAHDEARTEMQRILLMYPDHIESLNNLGVMEIAAGDFQASLIFFDRVLAKAPHEPKALYYKAMAFVYDHRISEARHLLELLASGQENAYKRNAADVLNLLNQQTFSSQ